MLREMLYRKRAVDESLGSYMERTNGYLKQIRKKNSIHGLAYSAQPYRWVGKDLRFRNREWLDSVASTNRGRQLHSKRFHVWRWEHLLVQYALSNEPMPWQEIAKDNVPGFLN